MADSDPWAAFPLAEAPAAAQPTQAAAADPWAAFPLESAATPQPAPLTVHASGWGDTLRGVGSGLVKGAAAVPGFLGDAAHAGEYGLAWAAAHGADKLGLLPPGKTASDFIDAVTKDPVLNGGSSGALDSLGRATSAPTTAGIVGGVESAVGQPLPAPTTKAGQIAENVTAFLPGALAGSSEASGLGQVARNVAAYGLAPAAASEVAGQGATALLGDRADPYARLVGGALGGLGGHIATAPASVDRILSGATRGVSDDQLAQARALQQRAAGIGVAITPAEAVAQVTGGGSSLPNLQRHVEGQGELTDYFAQRPAQVDAAARDAFARIAPYPSDPSQVAVAAQREAEGALGQIRQDRSNAAGRYYAGAAGDQVPQDRMAQVAQDVDALIAQHRANPDLVRGLQDLRRQIVDQPGTPGQPAVPGQRVPVTDPRTGAVIRYEQTSGTPAVPARPETYITGVPQLDELYGGLRDQYLGSPPLGQSGTDARMGRIAGQGVRLLNDALVDSSPMLAAGRTAHGIMTERWVAPREAGPIGQIAGSRDLQAQGNALYPSNPNVGSQFETREAVERLPDTAPAITRNHLETRFNEATQDNMGGPNQWGGAKFAAQAFGNGQQAANLDAGLGALPNGPVARSHLQVLADTLRATGQRQPIGSKTSYNRQLDEQLGAGTPAGTAASLALSPMRAKEYVRDWYEQRQVANNVEMLARALRGEDGFDRIAAARAAAPPEYYRSALANALLGRSALAAHAAIQGSSGPGR